MDTIILTDSSCDLPLEIIEKNQISFLGLNYHLSYGDYVDDFGKSLDYKKFYNSVREGEMPTTSQINIYRFQDTFRKYAKQGKSVIYIGMSSAISGCINCATMARDQLLEEMPNADITVIDSKSASIGQGILICKAAEMLSNGYSKCEIINWVEENKLNVNHWFIVDDLMHLKRGGRLSYTAATIGSILDIKPILCINRKGELINFNNIRGRKKAIRTLIKLFEENCINPENQVIGISHGDCIEDALFLKELVTEEFKVKDVIINYVGPAIGSHTGPGMLSLCFFGKERS